MKVLLASVRARVAEVEGNVIVVLSEPANVRILLMVNDLPFAYDVEVFTIFHAAAVVSDVETTVKVADVLAARIVIVLKPEDCTVTAPVDWLVTRYCWPRTRVAVTG